MRSLFAILMSMVFTGCVATQGDRVAVSERPDLVATDSALAQHFLDALYRPNSTKYRVIADAASEKSMGHIPLTKRNRDLSIRLSELRQAPASNIRVNLHSGDRPEPWGSDIFVYSYNTRTGEFVKVRRHRIEDDSSDMWIDVRHWPNGTRLISLSFTWIDDLKNNTFHLRSGERTFRFAIAIEPLTH